MQENKTFSLLNLACGSKISNDGDWTNVDFQSPLENVLEMNILKGLPFPENTFDAVYSAQFIEHLTLSEGKLVLENVIDYLNLYSDEDRVLEVLDELKPVSDIFLNLKEVNTEAKVNAENEKMIIGGSQINMTEAEFNSLKEAATNYRNNFANASQS